VGGVVVEGFEFNTATHRYRVTLRAVHEGEPGERPRVEEVDQVLVNAGFGPDDSLCRELHVGECFDARARATDDPEPGFHVVGHKSFGRSPDFLLETGYRQVADAIAALARELEAARA
jgi:hypothetical protein